VERLRSRWCPPALPAILVGDVPLAKRRDRDILLTRRSFSKNPAVAKAEINVVVGNWDVRS
jgi:hypothetical protein